MKIAVGLRAALVGVAADVGPAVGSAGRRRSAGAAARSRSGPVRSGPVRSGRVWSALVGLTVFAVLSGCTAAGATATETGSGDPPSPASDATAATAGSVAGTKPPLIDRWVPPADLPTAGEVTVAPIPGPVSGFDAADAWIYLPPAYATVPRGELPVLILMSGQPGTPEDWFDGGGVAATMDAYAADHEGLAPIVVVPDWLGTSGGNPLCVDSTAGGNDYSYLTIDVHDWIVHDLGVDPDPSRWAVGGLSAGGTCALQIAVRDPAQYPTVLAFSTQDHPSLEGDEDTVDVLFDGDEDAYAAVDPMAVLATSRFPDSAGLFATG
ncbi:MAG: alpha/beta hydrolase-fold protein, partial [Nakamurella sp.]